MIRFSARRAGLLLVAQGRVLIGEGRLLGTGRLFLFEHKHVDVTQYLNEKEQILELKNCNNSGSERKQTS